MDKPAQYQIDDQNRTSQLDELLTAAEEIFVYPNVKQAFELSVQLETWIKSNPAGFSDQKKDMLWAVIARLQFIALPMISTVEALNLFRQHLNEILELDIDLVEQVRFLLITLPVDDRNGLKTKISEAIEQNQQVVTHSASMAQGLNRMPSTLAEWVKYYYGFMQGKMSDRMREIEFFTKSPAIVILSAVEKMKIKRIFTLYRSLHYSSLSPEGFEESVVVQDRSGELKLFSNGNFEPIRNMGRRPGRPVRPQSQPAIGLRPLPAGITASSPLDLLKQKYQSYRGQRQHILEAEDNLIVKTRGDVDRIEHEMATATRDGNKYLVIACLKVLARQGALAAALKKNTSWLEATTGYLQKKYSGQYAADEVIYAISNQKIRPESPVLMAEFLQYVLREKLRMSENDSALIGSEIGQLMGGSYQGMAYGDSVTGDFQWARNKIENRMFISELGEHFV